jgi:hypothetical protein
MIQQHYFNHKCTNIGYVHQQHSLCTVAFVEIVDVLFVSGIGSPQFAMA